jgi:hypothetical protein
MHSLLLCREAGDMLVDLRPKVLETDVAVAFPPRNRQSDPIQAGASAVANM